jgi:transcriptional regulator with PAS, ATPase and Fis domain
VVERTLSVTETEHADGEDSDETADPWGLETLVAPTPELIRTRHPIGKALCIGRTEGPDVDLVVPDRLLSRKHASVSRRGPVFELVDHDSKNGSFVDGERSSRRALRDGSVVRLGSTLFVFTQIRPHAAATEGAKFLGSSPGFVDALASLDRVATTDVGTLILGETGTGKELAAERIHTQSGRRGDFVPVNCGAIPSQLIESYLFGHKKGAFTGATQDQAGVFERADGGTLFLDEIGELPIDLQPKLLRALENKEFTPVGMTTSRSTDVRVVAATNVDLEQAVEAGGFRRDLYARLAGYVIALPPLRERKQDIVLLADHFLSELGEGRAFEVTAGFYEALLLHSWPMNVRELRTLVQRILVDAEGDKLRASDLPSPLGGVEEHRPDQPTATAMAPPGGEELAQALRESGGSVAALAAKYGKDRKQIYRWLKKSDLDPESFR